jgi:hypothetical protein
MEKAENFLFTWRNKLLSENGPESSTTRYVMLALSTHMDLDGGSCYPSVRRLAIETAISRRAIMEHIGIAVENGWIERKSRILKDKGWKRNAYQAVIPKHIAKVVTEGDHVNEGGHFHAQGGNSGAQGGHFERIKVVTQGDLSSSSSTQKNSQVKSESKKPSEKGFSDSLLANNFFKPNFEPSEGGAFLQNEFSLSDDMSMSHHFSDIGGKDFARLEVLFENWKAEKVKAKCFSYDWPAAFKKFLNNDKRQNPGEYLDFIQMHKKYNKEC